MPPSAAAMYRTKSESAIEFRTQARPQRMPPIRTTIFGPKRSTNHPSIGTNQVSVSTKMLNATWMVGRPQWNRASIGLTNRVQPYCRFAIIVMQTMPRTSMTQRTVGPVAPVFWGITFPPYLLFEESHFQRGANPYVLARMSWGHKNVFT